MTGDYLPMLNLIHQKYNTWATYSRTEDTLQVHLLYSRVYDLIQENDFDNSHLREISEGN